MESHELFSYASKLTPEQWLEKLVDSVHGSQRDSLVLPTFPDPKIQEQFVGHSGEQALRTIFPFYRMILRSLEEKQLPLKAQSQVLDFGCGWGRIARFFYRDVFSQNLFLSDHYQKAIDLCKSTGMYGNLILNPSAPPSCFRDKHFDLIFAFSVFSHLSENMAVQWIKELTRVLKPGGFLIFTTQMRSFIEYCRQIRSGELLTDWHVALSKSFVDMESAYHDYDAGKFLFEHHYTGPSAPPPFYGEALIPRGYIEKNWNRELELIEFSDDWENLPQAYVVLRKRARS
jgi:2-polyprenyl-3-methyl-5-hydroxy-6-metoxy-1,4-benzoquinol methylase